VRIVAVDALEQARRIQEAVGRRAFEIFESRGSVPGRELEDWHRAETELTQARCSGQMKRDSSLWVETDPAIFEPGTIEIWVASRRITICGKPCVLHAVAGKKHREPDLVFHVVHLTCEVDPSQVTAKVDNAVSLEIVLKRADAESSATQELAAATA
jgi:hypothetical protein